MPRNLRTNPKALIIPDGWGEIIAISTSDAVGKTGTVPVVVLQNTTDRHGIVIGRELLEKISTQLEAAEAEAWWKERAVG